MTTNILVGLEQGTIICVSNKFPGDANLLVQGLHFVVITPASSICIPSNPIQVRGLGNVKLKNATGSHHPTYKVHLYFFAI